jgi:two-component system, cell cycle response regulator DivK
MARILIVEDNEKNRMLLRDILAHHGHEVLEAVNGQEGLDMAREHLPELIFMDIQMPVMSGLAAGEALKADERTRNIKTVALTSFAMKGDRERILASGFDEYMSKPLDTRRLPQLVLEMLGGARP